MSGPSAGQVYCPALSTALQPVDELFEIYEKQNVNEIKTTQHDLNRMLIVLNLCWKNKIKNRTTGGAVNGPVAANLIDWHTCFLALMAGSICH